MHGAWTADACLPGEAKQYRLPVTSDYNRGTATARFGACGGRRGASLAWNWASITAVQHPRSGIPSRAWTTSTRAPQRWSPRAAGGTPVRRQIVPDCARASWTPDLARGGHSRGTTIAPTTGFSGHIGHVNYERVPFNHTIGAGLRVDRGGIAAGGPLSYMWRTMESRANGLRPAVFHRPCSHVHR